MNNNNKSYAAKATYKRAVRRLCPMSLDTDIFRAGTGYLDVTVGQLLEHLWRLRDGQVMCASLLMSRTHLYKNKLLQLECLLLHNFVIFVRINSERFLLRRKLRHEARPFLRSY
jgi:hypothetical protein